MRSSAGLGSRLAAAALTISLSGIPVCLGQTGARPAGTLTGRAQIEKFYSDLFAADKTRVVKDEQRKVRFVTNDTALLDVDNVVTSRNGTNRNHATWIYVKRNGQWVSVAQRVIQKQ